MKKTYRFSLLERTNIRYDAEIQADSEEEARELLESPLNDFTWEEIDRDCIHKEIELEAVECGNCDFNNGYQCFECEIEEYKAKYPDAVYTDDCKWVLNGVEI